MDKSKIDVYNIMKFNLKLLRASKDLTAEELSIELGFARKRIADVESKAGSDLHRQFMNYIR